MKKYVFSAAAVFLAVSAAGCGAGGMSASAADDIGKNKAAEIALSDAGVTQEELSRLYVSLEQNHGLTYYEIEFDTPESCYDYEVQASDGLILKSEADKISSGGSDADSTGGAEPTEPPGSGTASPAPSATAAPTSAPADSGSQTPDCAALSFEAAKQLALDRVPGAGDRNIELELDHDDGYLIYEGEIHYNHMEYEFEIDASTGNFIKWSEDYND